jgi:hypothetical protein
VQLPAHVIRDTVTAVFNNKAYGRTSLLRRFGRWLLDHLNEWLNSIHPKGLPAPVLWAIVAILAIAVLAILGRMAYQLAEARKRDAELEGPGRSAVDAWAIARRLATAGDYTAAAHALYAGLLQALARTDQIVLDESKTTGDYVRELAHRSSTRLPRFREFARSYETVIYGIGFCDRDRFERLNTLASGIANG